MKELDSRLRTLAQAEETPLPEGFEVRLEETLSALPERRRGGRPLRTAILAACVCLALAGTVLAVDQDKGAHVVQFDGMDTPRQISFRAKLERC